MGNRRPKGNEPRQGRPWAARPSLATPSDANGDVGKGKAFAATRRRPGQLGARELRMGQKKSENGRFDATKGAPRCPFYKGGALRGFFIAENAENAEVSLW